MLDIVALSIIVAIIRRGSIMRLADLKIERIWLVFVPPALIVISVIIRKFMPSAVWVPATSWLHILANVALLFLFWSNLKLPGLKWLLVGWALNIVPIVANGGKMPVSAAAAKLAGAPPVRTAMRHLLMTSDTNANFLADFIPITRPPFVAPSVASPGDLIMWIGIFVLIQLTMCPRKSKCAVCEV